jgi:hypothetical protein
VNVERTNKKTPKKFLICFSSSVALIICGCATQEEPQVSSSAIDYYFSYDASSAQGGSLKFSTSNAIWTIEKAGMIAGEIGIHWEEPSAPRSADLRHDVPGGKVSPKIYGYFAVDLLKQQRIQLLKVEPGIYSHVHMCVMNEDSVKSMGGTISGIEKFPELKGGRSYYVSGKVANAAKTIEYPFRLYTSQTFDENTMGDISFRLQVFENDVYSFVVSPKFSTWFSGILFETLKPDSNGVVVINDESNYSASSAFIQKFTDRDPMSIDIKKQN